MTSHTLLLLPLLREQRDAVRGLLENYQLSEVRLTNGSLPRFVVMPGPETSLGDFLDAEDQLGALLGVPVSLVSARSQRGSELAGNSLPWEEACEPSAPIDGYAVGDRIRHYTADRAGAIIGFRHEMHDWHRSTVADVIWDDPDFSGRGSLAAFQMRPEAD